MTPHGQVTNDSFLWKCSDTTLTVPATASRFPSSQSMLTLRTYFVVPVLLARPATLVFRVFKAMRSFANRRQTLHQAALLLQRGCTRHSIAIVTRLLPAQSGVRVPVQAKRPDRLWCPTSLLFNEYRELLPRG